MQYCKPELIDLSDNKLGYGELPCGAGSTADSSCISNGSTAGGMCKNGSDVGTTCTTGGTPAP